MIPVISIVGPTSSGKSFIAHNLALKVKNELNIGVEIISCDSVQVYKHFDIGTDKVSTEQRREITYHLIDILEPDEGRFSAGQFRKSFDKIVEKIKSRRNIAVMVGGTGLYYKSVKVGFSECPEANNEIRNELISLAKTKGVEYLYKELESIDKMYSSKINKNDLKRIVRALEVFRITGRPLSEIHFHSKPSPHEIHSFLILPDRKVLYTKINERVSRMINRGLVDEVKWIIKNYGTEIYPLQSIGYKEIVQFLSGKISLEEATKLIMKNTRNFAKRQLTLFRHTPVDEIINLNEVSEQSLNEVIDKIFKKLISFRLSS